MEVKVSVIVPAYNREKTIERCIGSIAGQTLPPYEVIVVDDGSSDRTAELAEKCGGGPRVRVIRQDRRGAQAARNCGILNAEGNYIAFCDSDDEWLPDKLEAQVEALRRNEDAVVYGDYYVQTDWAGRVPKAYRAAAGKPEAGARRLCSVGGKSGYVYGEMLRNSCCLFQTLLTSRSNLMGIGLLDEEVPSFQEWDTAIRLAEKHEFIYLERPLFVYHLHDGETISKSTKKYIDGLEYIYGKFEKEAESVLGHKEITRRHRTLLIRCVEYGDARAFKYFAKYAAGIMSMYTRGK